MVKVSHETPLCLLGDSEKFNDYDYCLPHLLDEEESNKRMNIIGQNGNTGEHYD